MKISPEGLLELHSRKRLAGRMKKKAEIKR